MGIGIYYLEYYRMYTFLSFVRRYRSVCEREKKRQTRINDRDNGLSEIAEFAFSINF